MHAQPSAELCLQAKGITKRYPGTVALDNVDFEVYRGKVNVLIGENGAGKSTLMKIIAGIEQPTEGELRMNGRPVKLAGTRDAAAKGIGIIHQELNLFPNMTIAQNMFIGREHTRYGMLLDHDRHVEKTRDILRQLECDLDPHTPVSRLKVGQQQIVEIAKTLTQSEMQVLIMDEPTSSLSTAEVEVLFKLIRDLKAKGLAIIYISHRLEEIMRIGDYITVLRDGKLVARDEIANIDIPWIVRNMVGHDQVLSTNRPKRQPTEEVLRVENLTLRSPEGGFILKDVSFSLQKGEIVGIYGLMGAGRTELLETLMGLHPEAEGAVYLEGKPIKPTSVRNQIDRGFALVPEDRQRQGLVQPLSIAKNMTLSSLGKYFRRLFLSSKLENSSIARMIQNLYIKAPDPKLPILSLSGGNQQKVVIGKYLLTDPKILLLDEPSRGIDVGAKADVFNIIRQLAAEGVSILLVSSELKEILAYSDRVIVLSGGRLTGEFQDDQLTENNLVNASSKK
ncbi:ABC-type sugar transport system, ATPase component [Thermobacillus composti KWC4]|uniref:ABC-type sugar transport system, ATPase component n=1 Tax=Thermobacillus composti (strain DSM 18247 / JCM 13945 / KWC4) TaxID=717605 RepID=L0EE71_THECK|nr:sugar ABC transporter ATP-binding protein [Thermobacillus composti]AGA57440.1 ABC-type sugar transport system, ATPase component [Thermobacillus composti KWC4]